MVLVGNMKKACELCERMATVHCESDEASLCWHCDAAVHSANFLVARHSRKLLCHVCQSSTSSSVSGGKVGPAVSLCPQCVNRRICGENSGEDEETAVEMEDNQVVPWSPPPMLATESSTSTSESDGGGGGGGSGEEVNSKKRCRLEISSSNHPPLVRISHCILLISFLFVDIETQR